MVRAPFPTLGLAIAVLALAGCARPGPVTAGLSCAVQPAGQVWLAGGVMEMGAKPVHAEEGPPRRVETPAFGIDRTEVTNADFARFVAATGYVTVAERPLDPKLYPQAPASELTPASLVFDPDRAEIDNGWQLVPGAVWRHPEGPGSSLAGREREPVVHVAHEDALAYARWRGRDLPTEAEWEYAARAGLAGATFEWGDAPADAAHPRANTWQGLFPVSDSGGDGYKAKVAPVGCFAKNGYGLYDMTGNVWEWTRDWYRPGLTGDGHGPPEDLAFDPQDLRAKHVIKGGSFLCSENFCSRYRPGARQPGPPDSGSSHIGFRTVSRRAPAA